MSGARPPFTGRVNLFAEAAGLAVFDAAAIDRVNAIDEAITVATLTAYRAVEDGDMVATVKIIPVLDARSDARGGARAARAIARGVLRAVPAAAGRRRLDPAARSEDSVIAKTLRALEARLAPTGAARRRPRDRRRMISARSSRRLSGSRRPPTLLVVFGASAITDRRDVIPAAIEAFGGRIERFGMPVDPGNLLLLAARGDKPIVGAPGCARSPKENGFDWVLQRLIAGVADHRRRHPRHGRRRALDGDHFAAAAARTA